MAIYIVGPQIPLEIDLDENLVQNKMYDLENVSLSRGILDSSCCAGDGQHSMIELQIKLKRKSLFYDYIVIAPTIMLCVLTLASFLLPCDKGEKIAIGLTVFLTLYVLQLRIADNVPDTNSTPILGIFMLVVMTFNCVSLIMATVVMNIKKRGDITQCPEVPSWLFTLCEKGLGPIVCTLWKMAIPIPLSLFEEVIEQETAFDGPELSTRVSKMRTGIDKQSEEEHNGDNSQSARNREDDYHVEDHDCKLDKTSADFQRCDNSIRHVQFGGEYAIGVSNAYDQDSSLLDADSNLERNSENSENEYQVIKDMKEKFKTQHPIMKNSVNYSTKKKRFRMPDGSLSNSPESSEKCDNGIMNSETDEGPNVDNVHSSREKSEGIRQRRKLEHENTDWNDDIYNDTFYKSHDDLGISETDSFLPWSPDDVPTIEQARRNNARKRKWFYVAEVVDKFAFFVYLVLLTASIFTVLFLIPVTFRKSDA